MFDPMVEPRKNFWKYLDQWINYYENLPLKQKRKLLKILIIFRDINIF